LDEDEDGTVDVGMRAGMELSGSDMLEWYND
jgi:hypothetical protein